MASNQDKLTSAMIQSIHDAWRTMNSVAGFLFGLFLLGSILAMLFLLRWILSGGLSRQSGPAFLKQHVAQEQALNNLFEH